MSSAIAYKFNDTDIHQRSDDGYVDATAMCRANSKQFNDYFRLETTQAFLEALSLTTGIPVVKNSNYGDLALLESKEGRYGGTWIHPKAAINLGQWCSPEFAVFVSELVFAWMTGKTQVQPADPFAHPDIQQFHQMLLNGDLKASEMRLLLGLRQALAEGSFEDLTYPDLMARLGMDRSTFYRAVGRLRELGIVDLRVQRMMSVSIAPQLYADD